MLPIWSAALLGVSVILAGCAYFPTLDEVVPDRQKEYQKSQSLPDLEVPPDLTSESIKDTLPVPEVDETGTATYSTFQERSDRRKSEPPVEQLGPADRTTKDRTGEVETAIAVAAPPSDIREPLREFWREHGYELELDDAEGGVLQTGWLENRATQQRDQFKVSVEADEQAGSTVLHLSHSGQESYRSGDELAWRARARDPRLEKRMAAEIKAHLDRVGAPASVETEEPVPEPAPTPGEDADGAQATLLSAGEGKRYLRLREEFADAWPRTGRALGQVGIRVEEEDRDRGVYSVRYEASDPGATTEPGFWSRLAFWSDGEGREYAVQLTGVGDSTEIVVLDEDGDWDASEAADRILSLLESELNR